ncbi:hypothetical protein [Thermoactinomyces sp. CICC 10521]|uniref:hypothetical protein n=1 Tax=Thermoactinomyces sp. CICC 10521 TaxID=2767426 RepID=UPI0018DCADD9|nr:hypothetical protein [Thermoactinomyces sp. CICC 10521]MBH8606009.1 hypothetical protein [Thermoactinomyces sp. CICC 10521]
MAKVVRVKLPNPTPGGAVIDGRSIRVTLQSLISQISVELLDRRVTNFRTDSKAREIQIHFEEEHDDTT